MSTGFFMGRPPGRIQHRPFQMRASDEFLRSIDRWRRKQKDQPSRAEAIRRLVEQALGGPPDPPKPEADARPQSWLGKRLTRSATKPQPLRNARTGSAASSKGRMSSVMCAAISEKRTADSL
jgi:hypothetical protein